MPETPHDMAAPHALSSQPALEIDGLTVAFGGVRAVDDLSLAIAGGDVLGVVGPNGAGKSTLVQAISGFARPSAGRIRLFGKDVTRASPSRRAAIGLGRTFQTSRVFPALTVMESVLAGEQQRLIGSKDGRSIGPFGEVVAAILGSGSYLRRQRAMVGRAEVVMQLFGDRLWSRRDDPAHSLSYANRRRLDIARALVAEPRLLMLDEPTAGMNPTETAELAGVLEEVRQRYPDMAVLLIEHKLDVIRRLTGRTIVINQGKIIVDAPPAEALAHPEVTAAYLGRPSDAPRGDAEEAPKAPSLASGSSEALSSGLDIERCDVEAGDGAARAVVLSNVDVFYGPVQALFDVSIEVRQGEVVAVLGGNASGKSTVIKTVLGLTEVRSGTVELFGDAVAGRPTPARIALGLASIPEGRRMFAEMSVEDNLLLGAYVRRKDQDFDRANLLARVYEEFPWLAERRGQLAGTLSGGEQQMLAMARAWLRRPRLLCIDEPSMGLAPVMVDRVYAILERWKRAGLTILMVEQSANRALELADRAYVLQNGRIAIAGDSADLRQDPAIRTAYLGAESDEQPLPQLADA